MKCTICNDKASNDPCRVCGEIKFCKNCARFWAYQSKFIQAYDKSLVGNYTPYNFAMLPVCLNCRKNEQKKNNIRIAIMLPFAVLLFTYGIVKFAWLIILGFSIIIAFMYAIFMQNQKISSDINMLRQKKITFKDLKNYEKDVKAGIQKQSKVNK